MIKDNIRHYLQTPTHFEGDYGVEIETEALKKYTIPKFTFWDVKTDGSLRDFGQEYVLKVPLNYGDELTQGLMEFHDKTKGLNFIENSNSTSVHVHANILKDTWQTLANTITIYTLTENLLMEVSGASRRNNLFCLPIKSVPSINKISLDIFKNVNKRYYDFSRFMDMNAVKYAALNLSTIYRFGSLEFRSFRGVTDVETIQSWVDVIERIRVFSRTSITPPEIMNQFRKDGKAFLKDIFEDSWKGLRHDNEDKLLMDNLWFAGNLAYFFTPTEWKAFDLPPPPPKIPEGFTEADLMEQSMKFFQRGYYNLTPGEQEQIIGLLQMMTKKRKPKAVFATTPVWNYDTTPAYSANLGTGEPE